MKKFKDFLYDKNDIIIALSILIVAILLIIWRMQAIMEYPKQIISTTDSTVETPVTTTDDEDDATTTQDNGGSGDQDADSDILWSDNVLQKDIEVIVTGDSASAAIQCLIDAGLFTDYAEYQSTCESLGLDHQKVKAGTFTFSKGWGKSDIAKTVNWG